jgi:hypothetical protein
MELYLARKLVAWVQGKKWEDKNNVKENRYRFHNLRSLARRCSRLAVSRRSGDVAP